MDPPMDVVEIAWYLVQCKPRQEGRALEHLQRQDFECFCPNMWVETLKAGRMERRWQPIFPGYLFIHLRAQDNWAALRSTRGVRRIVGFPGRPCQVHERIIERLKQPCAGALNRAALNPGDRVQIKVGPYAELSAIFLAMNGEERVMLLLNLLNREQQIQVPLTHVNAQSD